MLIELECILAQVLPEAGECGAPFTLQELTDIANKYSDSTIPYSRVHRTWSTLYKNPATRKIVEPIAPHERRVALSAPAARRVLRRLWNSRIPAKLRQRHAYDARSHSLGNRSLQHAA